MFSCKQGQTSGSNITKKMLWWNYFCNNYKDYYINKCSKVLFCNNFGQDGIGPSSRFDTRGVTAKRRAFCKNPLLKIPSPWFLNCFRCNLRDIVSCDSVAIRVRVRIVLCVTSKTLALRNKAPLFFSPTSPYICNQASVLKVPKRGQFPIAILVCDNETLRFVG